MASLVFGCEFSPIEVESMTVSQALFWYDLALEHRQKHGDKES